MRLDSVYTAKYGHKFSFERPMILVANHRLSLPNVVDVLGACAEKGIPLVVFSQSCDKDLEVTITQNVAQGNLDCVFLPMPYAEEERRAWALDMRLMTGAAVLDDCYNTPTITDDLLGEVQSVSVTGNTVSIVPILPRAGADAHIHTLQSALDDPASTNYTREVLRRRLACVSAVKHEVASGGATRHDSELAYQNLHRATVACRMVQLHGALPGAGYAFQAYSRTPSERPLARMFKSAIRRPSGLLLGGKEWHVDCIYNVRANAYEALSATKVVDSTSALTSAVSSSVGLAVHAATLDLPV